MLFVAFVPVIGSSLYHRILFFLLFSFRIKLLFFIVASLLIQGFEDYGTAK